MGANMSISFRIITISLIIGSTFFYAFYEKSKIDKMHENSGEILQTLPEFTMYDLETNKPLSSEHILLNSEKGAIVHFWGTWCAPCEAELPSFIDFSKKFKGMGLNFYLVAVNDDKKKVKKFMKRFKKLPDHIKVTLDPEGVTLPLFGTVKVPETYLFNKEGKHLTKFIGPQDWSHPDYFKRVLRNIENSFSGKEEAKSTNN